MVLNRRLPLDILRSKLNKECEVISEGDDRYQESRKQFAWWSNTEKEAEDKFKPSLICIPIVESDVVEIVKFAGEHGYRIVARSGGHQYSGLSSSSATDESDKVIQIDLRNFNDLHIEGSEEDVVTEKYRKVTVGAGVRLREIYQVLHQYNLVICGGACRKLAETFGADSFSWRTTLCLPLVLFLFSFLL